MKKIEIHIFPEKTADKKFLRISVSRIICFIAAVIISITGFILFNPLEIFRLVSDKQVLRVYQENKFLKEEIQKTKNNLELAKQELAVTDSLKDSLFHDKAIQHISNSQLKEFFPLQVASYNIPDLTKHRKILLTSLQANKQIAKSLPLVMPLKEPYTITNRYTCEALAPTECMISNRCNAIWNRYTRETGAINECVVFNIGYAIGYSYARNLTTTNKAIRLNAFYRITAQR